MNNQNFNLLNQLIQEQKSLWRIENFYLPEATSKDETKLWKKMKTQKEKNIKELSALVKACLK